MCLPSELSSNSWVTHMDDIARCDGTNVAWGYEHFLASVIVEHDEEPDKCTVYDPETTGVDRMSSWLTVDTDSLVDLYHVR